ncbi:lipopolysaccharide biosynthesis protein [Kaistella daneshvariae]|uniref:Lipopolysaccharide biosynthesis protein n=1 Tax=Kaistella daneshvariae TaxID=2487074 RepID=A0ABM7C6P6_9FLAO|nr:lipopolysaccharide biosynthesis protein [Kaistella daneshvariae]AZI66639.1 lipopolysaccharide biosynthesis protein [Kaistella daneshvariae]
MSLKKQALSGMVWTFAEQFGTQLISFGISVFLARLLLPSDFGVIALFGVVMGISSTLIDGGLANSLIRTLKPEEKDYSTVFIFNMVMSVVLYCIVFITAPYVAQFYKLPILTNVIRVYSIILIISSFTSIQRIHFVKEMDFKTSFKIKLPSLIIGGISGISFAYFGFGVWSLVYSALIQSIISSIQYWLYSSWRPHMIFDMEKFKFHFGFGYKLALSGLLNNIFENIYTILIGKVFSVQQLGYYNRADSLRQMPVKNLSNALNKVSFPLFAKISHDDAKLKEVYKRMMGVVIFIIAPVLAVMVVSATPLIRFLLTEKWLPAVPYFQILSIAGLLYPIHAYNLNILQVKGRSDLFLKLEIIKKVLIVVIVVIAVQIGIYGLLWGQVFLSFLALGINTYYTGKMIDYKGTRQMIDLLPSIILALLTAIVVYAIDIFVLQELPDFFRLTAITLLFFILYLGFAFLLKFKELAYIRELLKK